MDWDCWNCSEDFGCDDSLDIDYQTAFDDIPYSSFEQLFDSIFQLCTDGFLDPDLAIAFFDAISYLSTFLISYPHF
jgi:hypothetical protein